MQEVRCGPAESETHNAEHFVAVASLSAQDADADAGADVPEAQRAVLQAESLLAQQGLLTQQFC